MERTGWAQVHSRLCGLGGKDKPCWVCLQRKSSHRKEENKMKRLLRAPGDASRRWKKMELTQLCWKEGRYEDISEVESVGFGKRSEEGRTRGKKIHGHLGGWKVAVLEAGRLGKEWGRREGNVPAFSSDYQWGPG